MSNLRYLGLEELQQARKDTVAYIAMTQRQVVRLNGIVGGQNERLKWIDHYIEEKKGTPYDLPAGLAGESPFIEPTRTPALYQQTIGRGIRKRKWWQRLIEHFASIPPAYWGGFPASLSRQRVEEIEEKRNGK